MNIKNKILSLYVNNPYKFILLLAVIVRLISVIFSQGYGWHDDHFLVIEASQSWVDGYDYNRWLPWNQENPTPAGHSFFYVGIHYCLFWIMKAVGIFNPYIKMFIIRLLHALYSLIIVVLGYKIVNHYTKRNDWALETMLLLAVFWFMPFLSVRNLVEWVCVGFVLLSIWIILITENKKSNWSWFLLAGFIGGLSFSVRFQSLFLLGGIGLALLIQKKWKETCWFGIGLIFSIILIQGIIDYFIWGKPFAEFFGYVNYNLLHKNNYGVNDYSMYFIVILAMLVPVISFFWFFGFLRCYKKYLLLFLPAVLFFIFHLYFPNKQERFIFPVIPFIIILGVMGWNEYRENSVWWNKKPLLWNKIYKAFWIINIPILLIISPMSSKLSRIKTAGYFYDKPFNLIIVEDKFHTSPIYLPLFYAGQWNREYQVLKEDYAAALRGEPSVIINISKLEKSSWPDYIIFCEQRELKERVDFINRYFPTLEFCKEVKPSLLDKLLYRLQPSGNRNYNYFIYKVDKAL